MVLLNRREYFQDPTKNICVPSPPAPRPVCLKAANDLSFPFGNIDELQPDDLRATAYEIFFTACRSSQGFGSRAATTVHPFENRDQKSRSPRSPGSPRSPNSPRSTRNGVSTAATSRVKMALGLKMLKKTPSTRRSNSLGSNPLSPRGYNNTPMSPKERFASLPSRNTIRRPLTSSEIMRQQMKVSEDSDIRIRKTLVRTLVGQSGRYANTIILPLELLRHLKVSEFDDANEYHAWQIRQLKTLEAGLLNHPSIPLEKADETIAKCLRDIINSSNVKPIDTNKNSETMKTISNSVVSLSWRSPNGAPTDVCRWADGYPLNVNLYLHLLRSIFDLKDETSVLDEIDELLELMKKTWPTLGITRPIHNLCLTWVFFQQYIMTGKVENDLLRAALTMLNEVANDAKKVEQDPIYVNMLFAMLNSMIKWSEKRLLNYHESFRGRVDLMENILPLVFSATKILEESGIEKYKDTSDSTENKVDRYIRSSLKNIFAKIVDNMSMINGSMKLLEESEKLIKLAKHTEELGLREKATFSPVLKKWNLFSAGVAAVTLHTSYGNLLRQFLAANPIISNETADVLQRADKLEKVFVNMVVEASIECEDGGKTVVREMVPYDVDSIMLTHLRQWSQDCLKRVKDVVETAKETETWNPKSKSEPYAQSTMELMKQTKEAVESFFDTPIGVSEDLVREFADAIEHVLEDYIAFVASCGSKQSYVPALPPLTRCGRGSTFTKLWRIAAPCGTNQNEPESDECNYSRPSTSRGTQRLYIRLNSLHYIFYQLNSIDKNLAVATRNTAVSPRNRFGGNRTNAGGSYLDQTRSAIQWATKHVSEIAAYKLIYLDSNSVFYGSLYIGDVETSRITPALKIMKQNLTLLTAIVTERAQPLAIKELMKATFDSYLRILLAGGIAREFTRSDHKTIEDDFMNLKKLFSTCGEGLIMEDVVDREAEAAEGVVALMAKSSELLVDWFSALVCDGNFAGGQKLPMPPTTGKWSSTDPNTILRVLCHRNEGAANLFLKKMFQLPKRK